MIRKEVIERAAIEAFKRIVDEDKNSYYNIFKSGFDAMSSLMEDHLQSLIKEWRLHNSSEGKYRLEAYKELMEFVTKQQTG